MKKSKIVWNDKTLDRFLAKPMAMVPGTVMTYDGVPDAADRADLIAYLKQVNETAQCERAASWHKSLGVFGRPVSAGNLSQIAVSSQNDAIKKLIGVFSLLDPM